MGGRPKPSAPTVQSGPSKARLRGIRAGSAYDLVHAPGRWGPSAVVTLGACPHAYDIIVNGTQQPSLWDDGKLRTTTAALAGMC